ncbi:MAG: PAS domain S-box protein, partial [bacterium]
MAWRTDLRQFLSDVFNAADPSPESLERTRRLLVQRQRVALRVILLAASLMAVRDLLSEQGALHSWNAVRLFGALFAVGLLMVLRIPRMARWAAPLGLLAATLLCAIVLAVSTLRHDLVMAPLVLIANALFAATFPWGAAWQLATVALSALTLLANALLVTGSVAPAFDSAGIAALSVFLGSLYIAYELERSRRAFDQRTAALQDQVVERRRAEVALQTNERRYRLLAEQQSDVIWTLDRDWRFSYLSPSVKRVRGYTAEEAMALSLEQTLTPASFETALALIAEESGRIDHSGDAARNFRTLDLEHWCKDGSTIWLELTINFVRDAQGLVSEILGVGRDVRLRKQTEVALRESEERGRQSFDLAPIGMALVAPDGRWLQVNRSLCDIVGYSEAELLATTFQAITHAGDLTVDLGYVQQMLSGEIRTYQMEKRYLHKQGHTVWILLTVSLVRAPDGSPTYFIAQIQDISARRRIEHTLQVSEERHRHISELSADYAYSFTIDKDGGVAAQWTTGALARVAQITGFSEAELARRGGGLAIVHPDDFVLAMQRLQRLLAGEEDTSELRILSKDGSVRWVRDHARPLWDEEQGRVTQVIAAAEDITERKRVAEALQRNERHFRSLIEHATDLIGVLDADGRVGYLSPSILPTLGYQPAEWQDRRVFEFIHPDDLAPLAEAFRNGTIGGAAATARTFRLRHRDGSWHTIEATATNLLADESVRGIVINAHDITDRVRAEAERERFFTLSSDLLAVTDFAGNFQRTNDAWEHLLGYTRADLVSVRARELIHPDDRAESVLAVRQLATGAPVANPQNRYLCKDGSYKWIEWAATVSPGEQLVYSSGRDITERKYVEVQMNHAKNAAESANRAKTEFLA